MKDEEEREWLENLPKNWWTNHDTVVLVASTLNRYGHFDNEDQVIHFFDKPWNYQKAVDELIKELSE